MNSPAIRNIALDKTGAATCGSVMRVTESRHLSTHILRPAKAVYDFVVDPRNLPRWAPGLGVDVAEQAGRWFVETGMGRVEIRFAKRNPFGVLDHDVTLPSGETFYNPMRVIPDGTNAEVVFTLRRQPDMSDADFDRDAATVAADLALLKRVLEADPYAD